MKVRRTKSDLKVCGYFEWLEDCRVLRGKKKAGEKLSAQEKMILKTVPTIENPYTPSNLEFKTKGTKTERKKQKTSSTTEGVMFDVTKEFKVSGRSFFCEVLKSPKTDEDCLLFCAQTSCPFHEKGYFRSKGVKF